MKIKNETPSKLFQTNIKLVNPSEENKNNNFNLLYDQAMREESLKNPVRNLTRSLNQSTSHTQRPLHQPRFLTEHYNLDKKIKEIRRITKEKGLDIKRKDNQISFSKDKVDIVFESTRLLKEIEKRKTNSLAETDGSIRNFIFDNKEIAIKNLLIRLLKRESNKLRKTEEDITDTLKEGNNNLMSQERIFNDLMEKQKTVCKDIESVLIEVQKSNFDLAETEKSYKIAYKLIEDEVEKYLEMINNKRICAKFILRVLRKDYSKFQKEIILKLPPAEPNQPSQKPNFAELAKTIINDYKFCLDQNSQLLEFLDDTCLLTDKYQEFEELIVKCLQSKRESREEYEKQANEQQSILEELKKREIIFTKEENDLRNHIQQLLQDMKMSKSGQNNKEIDAVPLVRELNYSICGKDMHSHVRKGKYKTIQDLADDTVQSLKFIEMKINEQIRTLTSYEYDSAAFYQIVNQRKNHNKEKKQMEAKLYLEHLLEVKQKKAEERFKRIVVQTRKTEAPYQPKKKKRNNLDDLMMNQKLDDDDLLYYH